MRLGKLGSYKCVLKDVFGKVGCFDVSDIRGRKSQVSILG